MNCLREAWDKKQRREELRLGHAVAVLVNTIIRRGLSEKDAARFKPYTAEDVFTRSDGEKLPPVERGGMTLKEFVRVQMVRDRMRRQREARERLRVLKSG